MQKQFYFRTNAQQLIDAQKKIKLYQSLLDGSSTNVEANQDGFLLKKKDGSHKQLSRREVALHLGKWKARLKWTTQPFEHRSTVFHKPANFEHWSSAERRKSEVRRDLYQSFLGNPSFDTEGHVFRHTHKDGSHKLLTAEEVAIHFAKWREWSRHYSNPHWDFEYTGFLETLDTFVGELISLSGDVLRSTASRIYNLSSLAKNFVTSFSFWTVVNYGLLWPADKGFVELALFNLIHVFFGAGLLAEIVAIGVFDITLTTYPNIGFGILMMIFVSFIISMFYILGKVPKITEKLSEAFKNISESILSDRAKSLAKNFKQHIVSTIVYGHEWNLSLDCVILGASFFAGVYLSPHKEILEISMYFLYRGFMGDFLIFLMAYEVCGIAIALPLHFLILYSMGLVRTGINKPARMQLHLHQA